MSKLCSENVEEGMRGIKYTNLKLSELEPYLTWVICVMHNNNYCCKHSTLYIDNGWGGVIV